MAGARVLEDGGNIVDAAIATSSTLCVTQNNMCGLGGDAFVLLKMDGRQVVNINGSGRAFNDLSIERFQERGMGELPQRGKDSVLTVPGLVRVWEDLHKKYGTMDVNDLLKYAHGYAREGFPVTQNYSQSIELSSMYLGEYSNWKEIFMKGSSPPLPGAIFKQEHLANTFQSLISDGLSSFYDGPLSERIVTGLKELGVPVVQEDLKRHESTIQEPVRTKYGDFEVFETAPNSQAVTSILWLNLLSLKGENPSLREILETGHIAYRERDKYVADPSFFPFPEKFTSAEYAKEILERPSMQGTSEEQVLDRGDTTYFSITDTDGNSISFIQSNYMGFGSGIVPKGTGIVLQNRGSYFSLDPEHHNALKPGKRTFHTLCAGMIEDESGYISSLGSMGGDIQPQLHIQLMLGLMKNEDDPQSVIDAPRWAFPYTIYEKPGVIMVENEELLREIKALFPDREVKNLGQSSHFGHAQITARLNNGTVVGGSDSRGDGVSIPAL